MKRLLFIAFTALSINAIAQTNTFPSSGNVGIGTTTPLSNLEVANSSGAILSISTNKINGSSASPLRPAIDFLGYANSNKARITATEETYNTYGSKLSILINDGSSATNLVERFSIITNGNIGIGTSAPNEKLEIGGNLRISNGENCSIFPTGHSLTFGGRQDYAYVSYLFRPSWGTPGSTYSNFQLQSANNSGVFTTAVMFTTDGGSSYINSGNVGIGTTNPDQKLTVKGKIHAEEVIVDLNVPVADYVFKPTYKLMPLPEVEQFVKINSHLPEIPSAEEVSQKGLSMGEMQNKLLQKVEELTLYMIGQQKTIDQQQAQIKELNNKLSKLNKQ